MPLTVVEYVRVDGSAPYASWFEDLAVQAAAKVAIARARLEMGKDGYDLVILLGGGTKRRQQADIQRAKMLWTEYKTRKAAESKAKGKR